MDLFSKQKSNIGGAFTVAKKPSNDGFKTVTVHRETLANNFSKQTSEKGMEIKKGIEFIKTGKDITDALKKRIQLLQVDDALIEDKKKTLVTLIGSNPDDTSTEGYGVDQKEYPSYKVEYKYNTVGGQSETPDATEKAKREYNQLVYKCHTVHREIKRLNRIIDNISPTQKIKLSEYDLEQYGI